MRNKKDIVQDALLTAKEIEQAAKHNAQDVIIEAFAPRLMDVVRQALSEEGPGPQLDSPVTALAKSEEENDEADGQLGNEDAAPEAIAPGTGTREVSPKGKKHSIDKPAPAPGNMTEEEEIDDEDFMEEGTEHDLGSQPGDLPRDAGDDDDDLVDEAMDYEDIDLDEADDEDELDLDDPDLEQEPVDTEDDVFEAEDDVEDEELDIPDELFDDEDDQDIDQDGPEGDEGGDVNINVDNDDAEDAPDDELGEMDDEELDIDIEDDEMDSAMIPDEEMEEGLYLRREGEFTKIDPADALTSRIEDLEEEREKLANAVGFLKGQIGEVNLFNSKLAHLVKLYESGLFSRSEKRKIAERLDTSKSIKQVQAIYNRIVKEADSRTVLDDIHDVITESRTRRTAKPTGESVYESAEVKRMRHLAGLDKD